jgi:predicted metalloendopeptidase
MSPAFSFGTEQDPKNSSLVIVAMNQGVLGLPNRDYYTKTDANSEKIRTAYVAHIAKTFELLGKPAADAQALATKVMALENTLALASRTPVQLRDPVANYNMISVGALKD